MEEIPEPIGKWDRRGEEISEGVPSLNAAINSFQYIITASLINAHFHQKQVLCCPTTNPSPHTPTTPPPPLTTTLQLFHIGYLKLFPQFSVKLLFTIYLHGSAYSNIVKPSNMYLTNQIAELFYNLVKKSSNPFKRKYIAPYKFCRHKINVIG